VANVPCVLCHSSILLAGIQYEQGISFFLFLSFLHVSGRNLDSYNQSLYVLVRSKIPFYRNVSTMCTIFYLLFLIFLSCSIFYILYLIFNIQSRYVGIYVGISFFLHHSVCYFTLFLLCALYVLCGKKSLVTEFVPIRVCSYLLL
jgi:hypothetical protein